MPIAKFNVGVTERGPGLKQARASLRRLTRTQVYVGIPAKNSSRTGAAGGSSSGSGSSSHITNPQLAWMLSHGVRDSNMRRIMQAGMNRGLQYNQALALYLHTHGSPSWQIPPRPILEPAIESPDNRARIEAQLRLAAEAAVSGRTDAEAAALRHLNLAGMLAQNAARAWFTDPRNGWAANAPSTIKRKGSARPNINTGEMRKSIVYVLRQSKDKE